MSSKEYEVSGLPLDLSRADRFIAESDDLIIEPGESDPKVAKTKTPVKGEKEA